MDLSNFKYKSSFSSEIKLLAPSDEDKKLAEASLADVKQYFPEDVNPDESPDLLYIAMPAYNGGICNRNGDGITKELAVYLAKKFKNKYIDLEHNRTRIVGNILGYGFVKHETTESLTEQEALDHDGPIDVILAGYIWSTVDENVTNLVLDANDPNSSNYGSISASWEVYYADHDIAVGSRFINQARILSDEKEIESYAKYLRINGGKGVDEQGNQVYQVLKGECLPIGLGLVGNPAAFVKGVSVLDNLNSADESNMEHGEDCECEECQEEISNSDNSELTNVVEKLKEQTQLVASLQENFNNLKNLVEENKKSVNSVTNLKTIPVNKNMKLKFEDLNQEVLSTASASEVYEIAKELNERMTKYAEEIDSSKNALEDSQAQASKLKEDHEELVAKLAEVQKQLDELNEVRAAEKLQNDFNIRMSELSEKFELNETQAGSIAKQIKGLSDEAYASWLETHESFLVAKKAPAPADDEEDEDEAPESEDEAPEDKFKKNKASEASLAEIIEQLKKEVKPVSTQVSANKTAEDAVNAAFGDLIPKENK